ncbi:fuculose phosphate aldolase [Anaeramoeba ignava]|uniref:Fuculose phosphate aldolase n=1 Tax=Anaeramoeba ignava TaxID=1746090 RepID=A0A9Q0RBC3_ANAIG|nr:fuculose phosphate aldolase [Anaeramoeba ignava]
MQNLPFKLNKKFSFSSFKFSSLKNPKKIQEYQNRVWDVCKQIYKGGLVEFGEGNVSHRVFKEDLEKNSIEQIFITPTHNDYSTIQQNDIVHVDFNGKLLSDSRKPSSELPLHLGIYKSRPKVNCIIHTHSPFASMLAVSGMDLPCIIEEMALFLGSGVKCSKFASAGSTELPKEALKAMGNINSCILKNHGVLVAYKDTKYAVKAALLIEKMSKIYIGAKQLGKVDILDLSQLKSLTQLFYDSISTTNN